MKNQKLLKLCLEKFNSFSAEEKEVVLYYFSREIIPFYYDVFWVKKFISNHSKELAWVKNRKLVEFSVCDINKLKEYNFCRFGFPSEDVGKFIEKEDFYISDYYFLFWNTLFPGKVTRNYSC